MNVHSLQGGHRENGSFVNVLITVSLTELNPLSIMTERKGVGVEGGTSKGRGTGRRFQSGPCRKEPLAARSNESACM